MKRIIFPGSFDPIHQGHVHMAKVASDTLDAEVIFVPAVISVWKNESAPFMNKMEMIKLSIKGYPRFSVSDYESKLDGDKHFTVDTIRYFKKSYPNDEIYLLIGEDQVNEFHRWKEADGISKLCQIIYYGRPGYIENENINTFKMINIPSDIEIPTSSSDIKNMKGLEFVDRDVLKYIEKHGLYYFNKINIHLSQRRLEHSISVANLAYDIALSNKLDNPIKAYVAGLLHDIGKEVEKETAKKMMTEFFIEYKDYPSFAFHQFIGSRIAIDEFDVDEEVAEAIMFHATGKANMSILGKIIYAADKIEPTRGFNSKDLIDSCLKDYSKGFLEVLVANRIFLYQKKGDRVLDNELTRACFSYYLKK